MKFKPFELFTLINVVENKLKYLTEKGLQNGSEAEALKSILAMLKEAVNA